jgi:hypothetical protein
MSKHSIPLGRLYTKHLIDSINLAYEEKSRVTERTLDMVGMSTPKVRHLINNIASLDDCRYLEVGLFKGATFCAANDGNEELVSVGIENFSEFQDENHTREGMSVRDTFWKNVTPILQHASHRAKIIEQDCFSINPSSLGKFNVYFYDGNHSFDMQRNAFHHFNNALDKIFICIIDDWFDTTNGPYDGTFRAFKELGYKARYLEELPANYPKEPMFHGGMLVGVLEKP